MFWVINDRKAKSNWLKPKREFTSRGKWLDTWIQTSLGLGLHLSSVLHVGFLLGLCVVMRQLLAATEQHPLGSSLAKNRGRLSSSECQQKSRCIWRLWLGPVPIATPRLWPGVCSVPTIPAPSRGTAAGQRRLRLKHMDRLPWIRTVFKRKSREG